MKGPSVCEKLLMKKDALEEVLLDAVTERIGVLVAGEGETLLKKAIEDEITAQGQDPRRESAKLRTRLKEIDEKAGMLLESMTPDTKDFIDMKLRELTAEKRRLTARVDELHATPYQPIDPDAVLRHGLAELEQLPQLLETCASLEERKEFIRMIVTGVTVEPDEKRLTIEMRKIPAVRDLMPPGSSSSVGMVAGGRYEPLQVKVAIRKRLVAGSGWRGIAA